MWIDFTKSEFKKEMEEYEDRKNKKELLYKCRKCLGTGLKDFKFGGYWTGEFCDKCRGKGLFYIFELIKQGYNIEDFYIEDKEDEKEC